MCVVKCRSLSRADHSSRGVLPNVVCTNECDQGPSWRKPGPLGLSNHKKIILARRLFGGGGVHPFSNWSGGMNGVNHKVPSNMFVPHQINQMREKKNYFENFTFIEHNNSQMATTRRRSEIFIVPNTMK
jgi:hypothetical protein